MDPILCLNFPHLLPFIHVHPDIHAKYKSYKENASSYRFKIFESKCVHLSAGIFKDTPPPRYTFGSFTNVAMAIAAAILAKRHWHLKRDNKTTSRTQFVAIKMANECSSTLDSKTERLKTACECNLQNWQIYKRTHITQIQIQIEIQNANNKCALAAKASALAININQHAKYAIRLLCV